jgi:hypothetical protein
MCFFLYSIKQTSCRALPDSHSNMGSTERLKRAVLVGGAVGVGVAAASRSTASAATDSTRKSLSGRLNGCTVALLPAATTSLARTLL